MSDARRQEPGRPQGRRERALSDRTLHAGKARDPAGISRTDARQPGIAFADLTGETATGPLLGEVKVYSPASPLIDNQTINQSHAPAKVERLRASPRCGAKTRRGAPCQSPAVHARKRCRMHGGTNPGAPSGEANGAFRTGRHMQRTQAARRLVRALVRHVLTGDTR